MDLNTDEVLNDFKNLLLKIDFSSYNPHSDEFMSALIVGVMWSLMCKLKCTGNEVKPVFEANEERDDISEKLFCAKKYFQKYMDFNDSSYLGMARDELKHAETLIKKANAKLPGGEEKAKIKMYETKLKEISEKING